MSSRIALTADSPGSRLDRYAAEHCQISRSYAQKLIAEGQITVNGRPSKSSYRVEAGDRIAATIPPSPPAALTPEDMPLDVVYEDGDILVVDKPAGLLVHPAAGRCTGTLANALVSRYPDLERAGGSLRPGIVHRLDKDTSGLMVVAKHEAARLDLSRQIKERAVLKGYLALVRGHLSPQRGAIEAPIGRHPGDRKRMAVVTGGREARTRYAVIEYLDGYTLVEAILETGRTHQLRVHFAAIGHPVFADPVYGRRSLLLDRQFLHAHRLGLRLPSSGELVEFTSALPADLARALSHFKAPRRAGPGSEAVGGL